MAGTINYLAPVDNASGKIFGKKQRFVAVTRKKGNRIRGCAVTGVRTTKLTPNELAVQAKFKAVQAAVRLRLQDPEYISVDQAAYNANKHLYTSLWHYVWKQVWDNYGL